MRIHTRRNFLRATKVHRDDESSHWRKELNDFGDIDPLH
jgi:hypothetical protein